MPTVWPLASLTLVLTGSCNLRCSYCFQTTRRAGRMDWPTAWAALAHLVRSPSLDRGLVLTGGEPVLEFGLLRRITEFLDRAAHPERPIRVTLLTNGTLLGEEETYFLAAHGVMLRISMDGGPAAQTARGSGTFECLDRLLDRLRRNHRAWYEGAVSVSATLTAANVTHLADSIEYLLSAQVPLVRLAPAAGAASYWDEAASRALAAQFDRIVAVSLEHVWSTGRVPLDALREPDGDPFDASQPMCGIAGGTKAVVDLDGHVYGCAPAIPAFGREAPSLLHRASRAMHIGHVSDPGLPDLLPAFEAALHACGLFGPRGDLQGPDGSCRACRHAGRCMVCPMAIAHAPAAADPTRVPDAVCAFNRIALESRSRFQEAAARVAPPAPARSGDAMELS